jgi:hypothetical protein
MMFTKPYTSLSAKYTKTSEHCDHKNVIPSKNGSELLLVSLAAGTICLLTYTYFDALTYSAKAQSAPPYI